MPPKGPLTLASERRRAAVVEDILFLLDHREDPERIATRVGYKDRGTMERVLRRWGETELMQRLSADVTMLSE